MGQLCNERRKFQSLRNHVQALLDDGATIAAREPLQLAYKGKALSVRHGILLCEPAPQALTDALEALARGERELRAQALDVCLQQLEAALAPYPPLRSFRSTIAKRNGIEPV
ncbi:hypothetical protein GNE00_15325 [Pseudomonas sp. JL972]|uniref:hypothetical protein n=1 Tax=Stutzerimonas degradans TaxID=2968968 RepID=UPI0012D98AB8|nr:hypothetical protein [Stutzerimonas degradans]MTZ15120.1 hypothetical protein [Stutzerimonas degradans]